MARRASATPDAPRRQAAPRARQARGEQARERLKAGALTALEQRGYYSVRIADVTEAAGVTPGLFYHYFPDLKTLMLEVLGDELARAEELENIEHGIPREDWYARIRAHTLFHVRRHHERPWLAQAIFLASDDLPEFRLAAREHYQRQLLLMVPHLHRLFPAAGLNSGSSMLLLYALAGQAEAVLREYYVRHNDSLPQFGTPEALAEWLATLFYRGLFLKNPPASGQGSPCIDWDQLKSP